MTKLFPVSEDVEVDGYRSEAGDTMRREFCLTPGGNEMNGRWVLRDITGKMIDFGRHRSDLAERYGFKISY
jgi:hypothetical protein